MMLINWRFNSFVRVVLVFILGIVLADANLLTQSHALIFFIIATCAWFLSYKVSVLKKGLSQSVSLLLIFTALGCLRYHVHNESQYPTYFYHNESEIKEYLVIVKEQPKTRSRTKTVVDVIARKSGDSFIKTRGQLLLYFPKNDTTAEQTIEPGDKLFIQGKVRDINPKTNPYTFDFKSYLYYRGIHHQLFLHDTVNYGLVSKSHQNFLQNKANQLRNKSLAVFEKYFDERENRAVLSAMVLGYRNQLDSEIYDKFTNTGAVHVLAVSGLHVGIICAIFVFLLERWKIKEHWGVMVKIGILVTVTGFYALLTGASPAVVRAAFMFTFYLVGRYFSKTTSVYNIMAFVALIMLVWDPYLLYQASFQFSFTSLLSILIFQPKIAVWWQPQSKFTRAIWNLATVALAAQVLVFPITIYFFHKFPNYFIVTGILAVPLAILLLKLGLGVLLLELVGLGFINKVYANLVNLMLELFNGVISYINSVPMSSANGLWLSTWQTIFLFMAIVGFSGVLYRRSSAMNILVTGVILFMGSRLWHFKENYTHHTMIVYDSYKGVILDLFYGPDALTDSSPSLSEEDIKFIATPFRNSMGHHVINSYDLSDKNYTIDWGGKRIYMMHQPSSTIPQYVDYFIIAAPKLLMDEQEMNDEMYGVFILTSVLNTKEREEWLTYLHQNEKYYLESSDGAVIDQWIMDHDYEDYK